MTAAVFAAFILGAALTVLAQRFADRRREARAADVAVDVRLDEPVMAAELEQPAQLRPVEAEPTPGYHPRHTWREQPAWGADTHQFHALLAREYSEDQIAQMGAMTT